MYVGFREFFKSAIFEKSISLKILHQVYRISFVLRQIFTNHNLLRIFCHIIERHYSQFLTYYFLSLCFQVPADVALASALPPADSSEPVTISVVHDHFDMFENAEVEDTSPRKIYRCDRCPYANVKRDYLLTHLRFHLTKSEFQCPYCDYRWELYHLHLKTLQFHGFVNTLEISNI